MEGVIFGILLYSFILTFFPAVIPAIVVVITSLAQPDSYGLYKTKNSTEVL